jgi:hypothetical protein
MTRKANLRIETRLGRPMEPICVHVCVDDRLLATVSLEEFENACETLNRIRHDEFGRLGAEN